MGHVVLVALVLLSVSIVNISAMVVSPGSSSSDGSSSIEKSPPSSEVDAAYDLALVERLDEIRNLISQADLDAMPLDEQNGFDYDGNAARNNHLSERHVAKDTKHRAHMLGSLLDNAQFRSAVNNKNRPSSSFNMDSYVKNLQKHISRVNENDELARKLKLMKPAPKRASCGNLNGNPMYKWICW